MFESRPFDEGARVPLTTGHESDDELEPPWWRPAKRSGRRTPLSRDAIVDAAVRVLDRHGVDGLTIRRLSDELGTGAASIYWHIAGKRELAELVYDHILGEIELPPIDLSQWREQLRASARSSFDVMRRHRDAVRLSLGSIPLGPNGLRMIEWNLALLRGAGLPDAIALFFGDLLGRYIDASVLDEQGFDDETKARFAEVVAHLSSLPADRFPNIVATIGDWGMESSIEEGTELDRFELGLDLLMRGLETYLPA